MKTLRHSKTSSRDPQSTVYLGTVRVHRLVLINRACPVTIQENSFSFFSSDIPEENKALLLLVLISVDRQVGTVYVFLGLLLP